VQWLLIRLGHPPAVTQAQVHLFTAINWGLLALDGLLGLVVLHRRWRKATALDRSGRPAAVALATAERNGQ
jgi:hypothetical protein